MAARNKWLSRALIIGRLGKHVRALTKTEASTMRRPSAPLTVKSGLTTPLLEEDLVIEAVPVGWKMVVVSALTYASS